MEVPARNLPASYRILSVHNIYYVHVPYRILSVYNI
ncbi:unnamed protein product [Brugia pahangi]|uniref:Uncharacterized protein n=1 Tax=Brugia pahangi TaxID=6280 RepID=A0A0N4TF46_BRUPA|nr:unnamed protein product [Brugia pahangi]